MLHESWNYIRENEQLFYESLQQHVLLSATALFVAVCLGVIFGIVCHHYKRVRHVILLFNNSMRVVPSIAIVTLAIPIMGTGFAPALLALTILAVPPVLIHTCVGLENVRDEHVEAGKAMGYTSRQLLWHVQWPLALPVILTGIRTATTEVIASATLAAFIGGGGLGTFIVTGMSVYSFAILLVGAIPIALLAIGSEVLFALYFKFRKTAAWSV